MIDWHSHILPAMDDGSRDMGESLAMLGALSAQGVDTVAATPHFYADEETVDAFLVRRETAYKTLAEQTGSSGIRILRGAEVRYYSGISRLEGLSRLTLEDSGLLLLEMPMAKWTDHTLRELTEMSGRQGIRLILAHIERYISLQERGTLERLLNEGVLMQVNASFFERLGSRHKAIRLLQEGYIHFLGSDCHNTTTRPPRIGSAYERIRRKCGEEFVTQMNEYGYHALEYKSKH